MTAVCYLACATPFASAQSPPLLPGQAYWSPSCNYAKSDAFADFNGDGITDGLVETWSNCILMYIGNGAGEFSKFPSINSGVQHRGLAVADFNGDSKLDAAVPSVSPNLLYVFYGDGAGGFAPPLSFWSTNAAAAAVAADMNLDGKPDVILVDAVSNVVVLFINDGTGGFFPFTTFPVGNKPMDLAAADLNHDGNIDIITVNKNSNDLTVLLGNGAGSLAWKDTIPVGTFQMDSAAANLALSDFDSDGSIDLAVPHDSFPGKISSFRGDGTGALVLAGVDDAGMAPWGAAAVDMNADGAPDVFVSDYYSYIFGKLLLMLGDGAFHFSVAATYLAGDGPTDLHVFDANNDGWPDVSVQGVGLIILLGDQTGELAAPREFQNVAKGSYAAAADLNLDGRPDLITTHTQTASVSVLLGIGGGNFGPASVYAVGNGPTALVAADLNNDGKTDVVTANNGDSTITFLRGDGLGGFSPPLLLSMGSHPKWVAVGDLNGDGKLDIGTANSDYSLTTRLGAPGGGYNIPFSWAIGDIPANLAFSDVSGDGKLDIIYTRTTSTVTVAVALGNGAGGFGAPQIYAADLYPRALAIHDISGDGNLDILTGNDIVGTISIFTNLGHGSFSQSSTIQDYTSGKMSVDALDVNSDGIVDIVSTEYSDTINVNCGLGGGAFAAGREFNAKWAYTVATGDFDGDGLVDFGIPDAENPSMFILLNLSIPKGVAPYGSGTPGCLGAHAMGATSVPKINNPGFRLTCTHAPPDALGLGLVADSEQNPGNDPFGLGILLLVDLFSAQEIYTLDFTADSQGNGSALAPIPADPTLVGKTYYAEAIWYWTAGPCAPSPYQLSSSDGLAITIVQ